MWLLIGQSVAIPAEPTSFKHRLDSASLPLSVLGNQVEVVVHCAADTGFDEPLDQILRTNTIGLAEVMVLAKGCKRLQVQHSSRKPSPLYVAFWPLPTALIAAAHLLWGLSSRCRVPHGALRLVVCGRVLEPDEALQLCAPKGGGDAVDGVRARQPERRAAGGGRPRHAAAGVLLPGQGHPGQWAPLFQGVAYLTKGLLGLMDYGLRTLNYCLYSQAKERGGIASEWPCCFSSVLGSHANHIYCRQFVGGIHTTHSKHP